MRPRASAPPEPLDDGGGGGGVADQMGGESAVFCTMPLPVLRILYRALFVCSRLQFTARDKASAVDGPFCWRRFTMSTARCCSSATVVVVVAMMGHKMACWFSRNQKLCPCLKKPYRRIYPTMEKKEERPVKRFVYQRKNTDAGVADPLQIARKKALEEAQWAASTDMTHRTSILTEGMWSDRFRLGVRVEDDDMVQDKNSQLKISAELFGRAKTIPQKAQYLADLIDGIPDGKVPADAPPACNTGPGGAIEKLDPPQKVPKLLITPTSPISRLIVVQPPGAGKTCIMLDILTNFLTEDYNIIIVGDADVFSSIKKGLRVCPAMGPGGRLIRDRNPGKDAWCTLYSNAKRDLLDQSQLPKGCEGGDKIGKANVYWLTYILFGNWLKGGHKKYTNDSIFEKNTLILMDEVHKLTAPTEERATGRWRESLLFVGEQLFKAPANNHLGGDRLYIVGFTATPIIDDPVQAICLATVMKGRSDPSIYTDKSMTKLRIDPKRFYTPEFVDTVSTVSVREPGPTQSERRMPTKQIAQVLKDNGCIIPAATTASKKTAASPAGTASATVSEHPCPITVNDRSKNIYSVYSLKPQTIDDLERLFSNLFFVTNNTADSRKYPRLVETSRLLAYTPEFATTAAAAMKKNLGKLAWPEVSNFADAVALKSYVRRRLSGAKHTDEDTEMMEKNAPKWRSLVHDLSKSREIAGKTAVYLGARTVAGVATSTEYLFGLSFYLQAKLGFIDGTSPQHTSSEFYTEVQDKDRISYSASSPGATVYMVADTSDANAKEVTAAKTAENTNTSTPHHRLALVGNIDFRESQIRAFNATPCVGQVHNGSTASHYSVILLGYESYKAIDLTCATNLVRMVLQPKGKTEQTIGRSHRQCSFSRVPQKDWRVNAITYIFHDKACPTADCDCVLGSFFEAQSGLQQQILSILRGTSIACSNFAPYNQWPKGTTCLLDKNAPLKLTPDQQDRNFFFCSYSGAWKYDDPHRKTDDIKLKHDDKIGENHVTLGKNDPTKELNQRRIAVERRHNVVDYRQAPIRPGISGDVKVEFVKSSCAGRCSKLDTKSETIHSEKLPPRERQSHQEQPLQRRRPVISDSKDIANKISSPHQQQPDTHHQHLHDINLTTRMSPDVSFDILKHYHPHLSQPLKTTSGAHAAAHQHAQPLKTTSGAAAAAHQHAQPQQHHQHDAADITLNQQISPEDSADILKYYKQHPTRTTTTTTTTAPTQPPPLPPPPRHSESKTRKKGDDKPSFGFPVRVPANVVRTS